MADDIGGVWRTIGGRRVFIKTGTTLQQAMKESGKFKNLGKKVKEKKRTEDDEKFKEMYKSSYDAWKEANPQLPDEEIIKILRAKQYNGELHADIKKGSQDNLANQIKNFDNTKVSNDKWSAEENFLARMKQAYDRVKSNSGEKEADEKINRVGVVEKNKDYLAYSIDTGNGEKEYEIVTSYNRDSEFRQPPDIYIRKDWHTGKIDQVQVNWAAYGSMSTKDTDEFIEQLKNASDFAKKLEKKIKK